MQKTGTGHPHTFFEACKVVGGVGAGSIGSVSCGPSFFCRQVSGPALLLLLLLLSAPIRCIDFIYPHSLTFPFPRTFDNNSVLGHRIPEVPVPLFSVYPATKHAITALCQTVRQEIHFLKLNIKLTVS